jgi:flagellar assembly protein FliH
MKSFSSALVQEGPVVPGTLVRMWAPVDLLEQPRVVEPEEGVPTVAEVEAAAAAALEATLAEERERAAAERERWIEEGYRAGFEAGRREGEIAEEARLRSAVAAAEEALEELRAGEIRWTGTIEENICALAVVVARQVIGRELAADVQPVLDLVRSALAEFPADQPMRIRVSPSDLAAIAQASSDEDNPMVTLTRRHDARWVADATIAPGGCVVEGRERIIDGRVDTALERVYRRLTYTHA